NGFIQNCFEVFSEIRIIKYLHKYKFKCFIINIGLKNKNKYKNAHFLPIFAALSKVDGSNTDNTLRGIEKDFNNFFKKSLLNQERCVPLQSQIFRGSEDIYKVCHSVS